MTTRQRPMHVVASETAMDLARAAARAGVTPSEMRDRGDTGRRVRSALLEETGVAADATDWAHAVRVLIDHTAKAARAAGTQHGECRACGSAVRWVTTANGKAMPIDPLPHPRGNVTLAPQGRSLLARVHPLEDLPLQQRAFRHHSVTCSGRPRRERSEPAPQCAVCRQPMDRHLHAAGERTHPCCTPYAVGPSSEVRP